MALSSLCWTSFVCVRHIKTSMAGHSVLRMGTLGTGQDDLQNDHRMTGGGRRLAKNRSRQTSVELVHVIRAANKAE